MIAAGLPLLTAVLGVGAAILSITLATQFFDIASQASTLALMLGLAVAIDYACSSSPATATRSETATTPRKPADGPWARPAPRSSSRASP